ncbi:MAG: glycosyltransferase [Ruminococcus sp.]|nr:glycosyltransferase [Ruminococcus sp.]
MKKILFVLPSLKTGGMENLAVTLANALVERDYDVTVMIFGEDCTKRDELHEGVRFVQKGPMKHIGENIPVIRRVLFDDDVWHFRASPRRFYRHYVGKEKYDVEIAFFRGNSVKIISGSTNKDAVHLTWVHNDFRIAGGYDQNFNNMEEVVAAYKTFDKVICVSEEAKKGFVETIGDTGNLMTVYNLIPKKKVKELSLQKQQTPFPKARLRLVIVARLLNEHKGHLRLITAVSRLRQEGSDISLTIIGDGPDSEAIRDRIASLNEEDSIVMTGSLSNPFPYIKNADMLVCSSYYEGYNLTVAEAVILGTPVLSTICAGPCEILDNGKYGMIVENSEEGLYRGLKEVYDHPELLREYREKEQQRQEFFDEDRIINQLTSLF